MSVTYFYTFKTITHGMFVNNRAKICRIKGWQKEYKRKNPTPLIKWGWDLIEFGLSDRLKAQSLYCH